MSLTSLPHLHCSQVSYRIQLLGACQGPRDQRPRGHGKDHGVVGKNHNGIGHNIVVLGSLVFGIHLFSLIFSWRWLRTIKLLETCKQAQHKQGLKNFVIDHFTFGHGIMVFGHGFVIAGHGLLVLIHGTAIFGHGNMVFVYVTNKTHNMIFFGSLTINNWIFNF